MDDLIPQYAVPSQGVTGLAFFDINLILLVLLEQFGLILLHMRRYRAGGPGGLVGRS